MRIKTIVIRILVLLFLLAVPACTPDDVPSPAQNQDSNGTEEIGPDGQGVIQV